MEVCLWGEIVSRNDLTKGNIIVIKEAKIHTWRENKTISSSFSTTIHINPDIPQVKELMTWNNSSGHNMDIEFKSANNPKTTIYNWKTINEIEEESANLDFSSE